MRLLHIVATPGSHEPIRISSALIEELYMKYEDLNIKVLDLIRADLPAVAGVNIVENREIVHRSRKVQEELHAKKERHRLQRNDGKL